MLAFIRHFLANSIYKSLKSYVVVVLLTYILLSLRDSCQKNLVRVENLDVTYYNVNLISGLRREDFVGKYVLLRYVLVEVSAQPPWHQYNLKSAMSNKMNVL